MEFLTQKRLVQIFYVFCLLLIGLLVHLGFIQLVEGEKYALGALQRETVTVPLEDFSRGQVLDRRLRPLTQGYLANRVVVFPQAIAEPERVAQGLAEILHCAREDLRKELEKPQVLPYSISARQAELIRERNWPGVLVVPVHFRYGPEPLAAQVVGYLGRAGAAEEAASAGSGGWVGKTGLERYYEQELKAARPQSYARLYTDARGQWLRGLGIEVNLKRPDPQRQDVVTTLDADVQQIVERVMDAHVQSGAVVVLDTRSGDILALAGRPKYNPDPQEIGRYLGGKPEALLDQGVGLFAPGSLFKVVVAAAALAEGVVTPETTFFCRGERDRPVRCWSAHGHGVITFEQAFAQSCNPVFARVAMELGAKKLIAYARLFGLDNQQIAGYPVPFDSRQNLDLIAAPDNLVNSSLGQGPVLATPVQIAAMLNTIVNDGWYLPPRLVKEVRTGDGKVVREIAPGPARRAISPEVARQLQKMLARVTTEGIGRKAFLPGGGSAGKTGSAQVGNGSVNAWFCGYAPLDNPRYVAAILVRNGAGGSQTAAPLFKLMMEQLLQNKFALEGAGKMEK